MAFKIIDRENWSRKEYFEHYFSNVPCTYSMTTKLDITKIIESKKKLYPAMLYYLTTIVNRHVEFRIAFNKDNELGAYDEILPCYTIFHKDTETFSNLWTVYCKDYEEFYKMYENDLRQYGNQKGMFGKPDVPDNCFTVSMIPWVSFEGFNLNLQKEYDYLLPIFTMGKYYEENGRILLPLAIQVHHAVCDGFHLCRFINELQELINS
ncbi:type A chloramphenicol O-acetyltransferase [Erysipelatoclostridium sp. An15]|uniref:type A chloramphenicol O-acetyltransferase n=1 Tax=Erysipelatoclostridium sp. An15 TaxID=1965566 RepID=UPI000B3A15CB|nr:type A chloramphenicol O-acetyltransferase [Erysipelatoclostridium sp. An15]OUQ07089.1 type A chloramphenicol O-acetyltransferase [Erysipelatoclostridium sp. An15]